MYNGDTDTECDYYVMKFMKEIAYEGVEILDNDNLKEYSVVDIDGICEDRSTCAVTSIKSQIIF
ncbi:hypothetical protein Hanom_Chr11g01007461 [Helianthus anomalus]